MKLNILVVASLGTSLLITSTFAADVKHATPKIQVDDYKEQVYNAGKDGISMVMIDIKEHFTGDIEATGDARFLQNRKPDGASFVGMEFITGKLDGKMGTFALQETGTVKGDDVVGIWSVVPGSGTGELKGLKGTGNFKAKLGKNADVVLDYSFE